MSYFITGTGTGVGKTRFASLLVKAIRDRGVDAVGMKPISTGDNTDADQLITASQSSEPRELLNPVHLATAASPFTASVIEGRIIDTDHILNCYRGLVERHDSVIVEGAGGWMVPIRPDFFVADLAAAMGIPVIILVPNRLGAINHTLLTLENIQRRGLICAGIVFNNHGASPDDVSTVTNRSVIETLVSVPILFELSSNQDVLSLDDCPLEISVMAGGSSSR